MRTCIAVSFAHNGSKLLPDDKLSHASIIKNSKFLFNTFLLIFFVKFVGSVKKNIDTQNAVIALIQCINGHFSKHSGKNFDKLSVNI